MKDTVWYTERWESQFSRIRREVIGLGGRRGLYVGYHEDSPFLTFLGLDDGR